MDINSPKKPWEFRYAVPQPPAGQAVELSEEQAEKLLLEQAQKSTEDPVSALWALAQFYKSVGRHESALDYLHKLLVFVPDPEAKAQCVLALGQTMESTGDYQAAVLYYRAALALEPTETLTWYFIHNNLGFSLNVLGKFEEGERYCRKAIQINPDRPNAHKNLGIALQGLGRCREAARSFISATKVNASDPRAFGLLTELLTSHSELQPEFAAEAAYCRQAVEVAAGECQRALKAAR
jgi:tetratricopeptide (TPR) repeat protein